MSLVEKLFRLPVHEYSPWKRRAVRFVQFLVQVVAEYSRDDCSIRASAMTYTTLLALVPLTTVFFSMFTTLAAFEGAKETVQNFLFNFLIPAKSGEIQQYFTEFSGNAKALSFIGSIGLLVTSIMLFNHIENSLNHVWRAKNERKFYMKFIIFTSLLVWGTIFIGASVYISGRIQAMFSFDTLGEINFLGKLVISLFPTGLASAGFVLMMLFVPSVKVRFKSALIGGISGGVLWEVAKQAFGNWAADSVNYSVLYGSLALIPIFLVWLYLTWIIIMIATEITYVHQNFRALMMNRLAPDLSSRDRMLLSLQIYFFIATRFRNGEGAVDSDAIFERFNVPVETAQEILLKFRDAGLVLIVEEPKPGYVPSRDLSTVTVREILHRIYAFPEKSQIVEELAPSDLRAMEVIERFEKDGIEGLGDAGVARVLDSPAT
ncbi:MAG: YihY family inner membrane protein [Deltaproteobacteria bacterium]|nr:YihY family inner membrane protein [bacterium]MCB9490193.1 YihY family inner membrane protein [Deltaproteobacteria bacterium]